MNDTYMPGTVSDHMCHNEFVTYRTFCPPEYRTHSQYTENYMTMEGLDFYKYNPGEKIKEVANAARKYNKEKRLSLVPTKKQI